MDAPFSIYDASAGSGKTFTVVRQYLKLLLTSKRHDAFRHILAITFTNKAAAEMKTRLVDSLRKLSEPGHESDMFFQLQEATQLTSEKLHHKAALVLKAILHNYASFEISTIDGFTHRLLRTFAKDLKLPVNFEVDMETDLLLAETVDRLLAKTGQDKKLTETLIDFTLAKADEDKSWDIGHDLNDISKLLTNENNLLALEKLDGIDLNGFKTFKKETQKKIETHKVQLKTAGDDFLIFIDNHGLAFNDFNRQYVPKHFQKMADGHHNHPSEAKWRHHIESDTLYKKSTPEASKQTINRLQPEIAERYRATERRLFEISFFEKILSNLSSLSLLSSIYNELQELKKEREVLPIFEFNRKIAESIQGQPAPFIYERLGERYRYFFIDEFQDTSLLQWSNLQPLIDNSLSAASEESPGGLMLVGDAKQAIYRWRGGKAEQFMFLSQNEDGQNPFRVKKKRSKLGANYRSREEIVQFNNAFFKHCSAFLSQPVYRSLFEEASQTQQRKAGGYVNISFLDCESKEDEMEAFPEKTALTIQDLIDKGHAYSDIAVLVRKKKEGIAISEHLSKHEIPIISSETLLLKNSPEVNFVMALLEFSQNPTENDLKYRLLDLAWRYQWVNDNDGRYAFIEKMIAFNGIHFFKAWAEYTIDIDLIKFQQLPLYDAVEYILASFKFMKGSNAYIHYFLDVVFEYNQKKSGGLTGFLEYWHDQADKLSISAPEGENAVQVMTIHKSKGLEFPIVIFPFADQKIDDISKDSLWVDLEKTHTLPIAYLRASKKMLDYNTSSQKAYQELIEQTELDNLNLFYVTMTRAREQLFILSQLNVDKNGNEKTAYLSGLLISFLKEMGKWDTETHCFGQPPHPIDHHLEEKQQTLEIPLQSRQLDNASMSVITRSGELWNSQAEEAINEGNLVHTLLSKITYQSDLDLTLEKALNSGLLTNKNLNYYRSYLNKIIDHPKLKSFFTLKYEVYNEREIIQNKDFYRLDRLCFHQENKKATIIDYKTGTPKKRDQEQILQYAQLLNDMNYSVQNKILVYIEQDVELQFV